MALGRDGRREYGNRHAATPTDAPVRDRRQGVARRFLVRSSVLVQSPEKQREHRADRRAAAFRDKHQQTREGDASDRVDNLERKILGRIMLEEEAERARFVRVITNSLAEMP